MQIPYHWLDAHKLAKKIYKDFIGKVSYKDFINWNCYKKYQYINKGRYPLTVIIRHTKYWRCYSDWDNELIKMNITSDIEIDKLPSHLDTGRTKWEDSILTTLVHEVTHYFQHYFNLDATLSKQELLHFSLNNKGNYASYKTLFLYFTNWEEMDADLSAIHFAKNYKNITKKTLEDYYGDWSFNNQNSVKLLAEYVYNYFWNNIKDFELRKKIENEEIIID